MAKVNKHQPGLAERLKQAEEAKKRFFRPVKNLQDAKKLGDAKKLTITTEAKRQVDEFAKFTFTPPPVLVKARQTGKAGWDEEILRQLITTSGYEHAATHTWQTADEESADPVDDWADKWAKEQEKK